MFRHALRNIGLAAIALVVVLVLSPAHAYAQKGGGGSGSGADTIKVSKCEYFITGPGTYVELLINASSSNTNATLDAYLPSGQLLGQVQNGGGGRYGGTVFTAAKPPATITIKSSGGGSITVTCVQGQP